MSHTNSTANYQLPQFLGTDKPAWLTDVNQAYADIDVAMKANEVSAGQANALATQNASAISTMSGQISTLSTKVTALETAQPTDEAQIETNRQNIATNAQNIVEIDNRLGHTSIATIADGTVTGAIDDLQTQISAIPTPTNPDADDVSYDNQTSGLTATNVQDAIDELAGSSTEEVLADYYTPNAQTYSAIGDALYTAIQASGKTLNSTARLIKYTSADPKDFRVYNLMLTDSNLLFIGNESTTTNLVITRAELASSGSHFGFFTGTTYSSIDSASVNAHMKVVQTKA